LPLFVKQKLGGQKYLPAESPNYWEMQPNYLGGFTPHPHQVCTLLSLTSAGRKIKELNLITVD